MLFKKRSHAPGIFSARCSDQIHQCLLAGLPGEFRHIQPQKIPVGFAVQIFHGGTNGFGFTDAGGTKQEQSPARTPRRAEVAPAVFQTITQIRNDIFLTDDTSLEKVLQAIGQLQMFLGNLG